MTDILLALGCGLGVGVLIGAAAGYRLLGQGLDMLTDAVGKTASAIAFPAPPSHVEAPDGPSAEWNAEDQIPVPPEWMRWEQEDAAAAES